jgi:uncharacterized protein YciI
MKYFALFYETVDDMVNRRAPYRDEHLRRIREAHARGELFMAGAVGDPVHGALIVFRAESPAVAEEFARRDPYVVNGLITKWVVSPWHIVAGPDAAAQGKPR